MKIKVLVFQHDLHRKNLAAMIHYPDFEFVATSNQADVYQYEYIYSPNQEIPVSLFPNKKFIFGPHFSVLPDSKLDVIAGTNAVYICPSDWVVNLWKKLNPVPNVQFACLPFGVDTETYKPIKEIQQRSQVFLYFKRRDPLELEQVQTFLQTMRIPYRIFDYVSGYQEEEYLECLQNAKYGIILDAHESQGFAVLEAMSCDVPLFVWSVTHLNQEYLSTYPSVEATTVPYWDARCGEIVTRQMDIPLYFSFFLSKLEKGYYQPRSYILQNLTHEICSKKMKDLFLSLG